MKDRQRGALIGLAVGDALGAAVEFKSPGTFPPVTGYRLGGPHPVPLGGWTDDTSMALAMADAMEGEWDIDLQISNYALWHDVGRFSVIGRCFDIGGITAGSLAAWKRSGNAWTSGATDERSSGNGSIMRLAPVPIYSTVNANNDSLLAITASLAKESSIPTHASSQCTSACRYMAAIMAAMIKGESRKSVLSPRWRGIRILNEIERLDPAILAVARGSYRKKQPPEIRGSGWVVASLEAALWAFHDAANFEEAVLKAVNLGCDADTTGSITGQLAGAFWGESGIPQHLRDGLARMDMIEKALKSLKVDK